MKTKALYNLLQYSLVEDPTLEVQPWQVENLRNCSLDSLFVRLTELGINLDKDLFLAYGDKCEDPEELALFFREDVSEESDKIYLLLFELWRRLLPEKVSLSIFCDELDYRIFQYDQGGVEYTDSVDELLEEFLDILNNSEGESNHQEVFLAIHEYLAHDMESFLYDYIADKIELGDDSEANDLLDDFYPYFSNRSWFDFLKARIVIKSDEPLADSIIAHIISSKDALIEVDLALEMLHFMVQQVDPKLFVQLAQITLGLVTDEFDLQELIEVVADFYLRLDLDKWSAELESILKSRADRDLSSVVEKDDKDLARLERIFSRKREDF